jgi:glycosyltransferase involved in cell wall biosynthesis
VIDVSCEISTYNRKDVLRSVLEGLARQTYAPDRFEVIISDDGSSDGLLQMVEEMAAHLPFTVHSLAHAHRGPGYVHNQGIRACRGDVVVMLAADIIPVPELVEEHLRSHRQHPKSEVVVAGRIVQSEHLPDTVFQRAFNSLVQDIFAGASSLVSHGGFLVSNLSFKKGFLINQGMFREWPPASGEDLELGYRLRRAGMTIVQNERALGQHHHPETVESVARRAYLTGYNSHYFAGEVAEEWVERRFAAPRLVDRPGAYLAKGVRDLVRPLLVNRFLTTRMALPLLHRAERQHGVSAGGLLPSITPALCRRLTAYYFAMGLADYRAGRALDLARVAV